MFFPGSLQEALASAVQNSRAVVCFVTDDGEESQTWENEFLTQGPISHLISSNAVALRLKAGSEEAGYLAAIFPVPKFPTLVVLRNGQLKEYIAPGTTKDEFTSRILSSLSTSTAAPVPAASGQEATPSGTANASSGTVTAIQETSDAQPAVAAQPTAPTGPTIVQSDTPAPDAPMPASEGSSRSVQALLAERTARLNQQREEAKKKALEAYARKAKGKDKADPDADDDNKYRTPEQKKLAEDIKKRQKEAAEERKRILQRIEADKADRRAVREALKREPTSGDVAAALANAPTTKIAKTSSLTALVVRLYDGSTLRSRFPHASTIRHDIRKWVDESRKDGVNDPYAFRVALSPTSTRLIEETEEEKSLQDLGLSPSATLVLVPGPKPAASTGNGLFGWLYALILSFFSSLFDFGPRPNPGSEEIEMRSFRPQPQQQQPPQGRTTGARVQTLHDAEQRRRRDHQLYNGNSLNFEPRPDDEE
ncbi:hypothetical protein jhhlp_003980 [Lomentospora prolificans]|uniref:UBX domain-containing protein 2 n=1 Tax=Lomentospora prolificans TaxID=41688 RepID=A0A2N3NA95_9PEZI|nr:hypothetical protein jhhlp_003980 [Lomentospora prolificans]